MQADILLLGSLWFLKSIYFTWLKVHQIFQIMHGTVVALVHIIVFHSYSHYKVKSMDSNT